MKGLEGVLDQPIPENSTSKEDPMYSAPADWLSVAAQQTALLISVRSIESSLKSMNKALKAIAGWIVFFGLMLLISEFLGCVGIL